MAKDIINIEDIFSLIKRQWKILASIVVIFTVGAALISTFILKPKYETSIKLFIGKQNTVQQHGQIGYDSSEVNMYQNLMKTYAQIATTKDYVKQALEKINISGSAGSVNSVMSGLSVVPSNDTQILTITYKTTNKDELVPIINSVTNVFMTNSKLLIPNGSIHIIEAAQAPIKPVSPNKTLNTIIGFIIGIIVAIAVVLIMDYFDNTVKSKDDLERLLEDIPVIGKIPYVEERGRR
ncbi:MAG: YveK family protein [Sarcina sp.]